MPIITSSGNTGKSELRFSPNGVAVLTVSIADNQYNSKTKENETIWVNAKWLGKTAEKLAEVMDKVKSIVVIGKEQYRVYEGKIYRDVLVSEHSIIAWKPKGTKQKEEEPFTDGGEPIDINDDDLPF